MPSVYSEPLFKLIKTLTKSEKRNFKLYANRIQSQEEVKFIQLFDVLDKLSCYDEEQILKRISSIKKSQLSNLKRHLYKQLLVSLRMVHIQKNIDIQIREQLDFAKILYNKGLYQQSLKLLERVKTIAFENHQDIHHLEIVEFEKLIESRHITRSIENRADELAVESEKRNQIISKTGLLSNLALRLYGLYIQVGHIRNQKDAYFMWEFFKTNLPELDINKLTFFEKIYLYQCYVWYNYILQDFLKCYKYAYKWVDLYKQNPSMSLNDPTMLMRGYNNLLAALFYIGYHQKYCSALNEFEAFTEKNYLSFNTNGKLLSFQFLETARINKYFMEGRFKDGLVLIPEIEKQLKEFDLHLDEHRVMVFYYKIACLYFGSGKNEETIEYLNRIINIKAGQLRGDIQCYARILHLIAHYELGHFELLEYITKSVYRFLAKMEDLNLVQTEILKFLKTALYLDQNDLQQAFLKLKNRLEIFREHPYEKRSFLYLDIISWLESKLSKKHIGEIIREKFLKSQAQHSA